MPYLAIMGRQPAISQAELISLYPGQVEILGLEAVIISAEDINYGRLGGTVKLAKIIQSLPPEGLDKAVARLADLLPPYLSGNKIPLGLSLYGFKVSPKAGFAMALQLKKLLRQSGLAVRIIPGLQVDAAQIHHNRLVETGADVVVVATPNNYYVGLTINVQDIERYGLRDHGRPHRSPKVGMLPPKLAQIMVNLAAPPPESAVLDPFCGTGVILQEALLMGYSAYGSDIDPDLVAMSEGNLSWLAANFGPVPPYSLETGDATAMRWGQTIGAVVTEGYLGPALTSSPAPDQLRQLKSQASQLTLQFLKNLSPQIAPSTPICMTLPAWRQGQGFERLNILDQIEALGYTLKQFLPVPQPDLLYARPGQIVGREIVTLIKK